MYAYMRAYPSVFMCVTNMYICMHVMYTSYAHISCRKLRSYTLDQILLHKSTCCAYLLFPSLTRLQATRNINTTTRKSSKQLSKQYAQRMLGFGLIYHKHSQTCLL